MWQTNLKLGEFIPLKIDDELDLSEEIGVMIVGADIANRDNFVKSVVLKIKCPPSLPIVRPEFEKEDMNSWQCLSQGSGLFSCKAVRRFFRKDRGRNMVKIGDWTLTIYPFFKNRENMLSQGYVCQVKVRKLK